MPRATNRSNDRGSSGSDWKLPRVGHYANHGLVEPGAYEINKLPRLSDAVER